MKLSHAAGTVRGSLWPTAIAGLMLCVTIWEARELMAQQSTIANNENLLPESLIAGESLDQNRSFTSGTDGAVTPLTRDSVQWIQVHPVSTPPRFKLRGRIDADFIWSNQSGGNRAEFGDLGDPIGLRRARIGAEGHLSPESRYVAEIDLATGQVVIRDLYLGIGNTKESGEFRLGHMREPFSLEGGTSANSFAFMERSLANRFDPARNWGVGFTRCSENEMVTVAGGIFQAGTDASDLQFQNGSTTALTARLTGLAWYESEGRRLMHFGLAISERLADQGIISIVRRPNSPLLSTGDSTDSPFVPRLTFSADFQQLINLQWAFVNGAFWSQAEWYASIIDQQNGGAVFYHGSYVDVGYFLTGEYRHYLTQTGFFGPVIVNHPVVSGFSSRKTEEELGFGAWEATFRCAYLDTIDVNGPTGPTGQPVGSQVPQFTAGMNWYLADRLRVMFNFNYALPYEATSGTTTANLFAMRLAMFW